MHLAQANPRVARVNPWLGQAHPRVGQRRLPVIENSAASAASSPTTMRAPLLSPAQLDKVLRAACPQAPPQGEQPEPSPTNAFIKVQHPALSWVRAGDAADDFEPIE